MGKPVFPTQTTRPKERRGVEGGKCIDEEAKKERRQKSEVETGLGSLTDTRQFRLINHIGNKAPMDHSDGQKLSINATLDAITQNIMSTAQVANIDDER